MKGPETSVVITGSAVVGVSAATSATRQSSMLQSTMSQIMTGEFTLYLSDIVTLVGLALSTIGVVIALLRFTRDKTSKTKERE